MSDSSYLTAEAQARVEIDKMLVAAGWIVQDEKAANLGAGPGVAIREFHMAPGHGRADYMLFVDRQAVGTLEAKKVGASLTGVEIQSSKYLQGLPSNLPAALTPLPFAYESTGIETRFTNRLDPEPRSRPVFAIHRPETLRQWVHAAKQTPPEPNLRTRLTQMPPLAEAGLRTVQVNAIKNLEVSMAENRPRALIQMATGSGKTFTAVTSSYRQIKYGGAKRILFLVDRAQLGRQALKEFQQYVTPDDGRKFMELYNVQHLQSQVIDPVSRVTISTIQRLYSILRGDAAMAEDLDEASSYEVLSTVKPIEVAYNPAVPPETFDVIYVDECHRSIYGVWRQVLDYFDAHKIGLTATPSKQTFGYFDQNLVMEYGHEQAVADEVNVDFDVYRIKTEITKSGSKVEAGLHTAFRSRETKKVRWETLDETLPYEARELDRKVVAKDQIRTIIRTFKERLFTEIFPGRTEVPKTLIFAKDDSHADDIVQIVREEFGKGNDFAVKITYRTTGKKPDELLADFRNSYNPRIAVTVDMIATGTDVKPLECVFFMRSVESRTYFEQMKGRGSRTMQPDDFKAVTPDADAKTRFVIVDAVGVTETALVDSQPLDQDPTIGMDKLLKLVALGDRDTKLVSTIASRLARLTKVITKGDREQLEAVGGLDLSDLVKQMVNAVDPDVQLEEAQKDTGLMEPPPEAVEAAAKRLMDAAVEPLAANPEFRNKLLDVRRSYEQVIDEYSQDRLLLAAPAPANTENAKAMVTDFRKFIEDHKDEITALQVLYSRPYKQRLTYADVKELAAAIERPPQGWTKEKLWEAYLNLEKNRVRGSKARTLTDLVALVRFALEQDAELVPFADQVDARFQNWLDQQRQAGIEFTPTQLQWLELIKDHLATSLTISADDFDMPPFIQHGGIGKAYQVFGQELSPLLEQLTEALAA